MAERKSTEQLTDHDYTKPSTSSQSTLIEDLNALSQDTFQSRFFTTTTSTAPSPSHNTTSWTTELFFADNLPSTLFQQCFALIESTSRHDYEPSSFGWHPRRKKREMQESEMRYLLLHHESSTSGSTATRGRLAGFVSFMFTYDSTPAMPVLYIYEIHLEESARGKGVGNWLMRVMEGVGREAGVEKMMLTCFVKNESALAFYRKGGFEVDSCSPGDRKTRTKVFKADYVILSKRLSRVERDEEICAAVKENG